MWTESKSKSRVWCMGLHSMEITLSQWCIVIGYGYFMTSIPPIFQQDIFWNICRISQSNWIDSIERILIIHHNVQRQNRGGILVMKLSYPMAIHPCDSVISMLCTMIGNRKINNPRCGNTWTAIWWMASRQVAIHICEPSGGLTGCKYFLVYDVLPQNQDASTILLTAGDSWFDSPQ